jgi:hypothetical protein
MLILFKPCRLAGFFILGAKRSAEFATDIAATSFFIATPGICYWSQAETKM